ncbi:MAG: ThuA domain-containing protein, partial [Oscillospiraceae bacterium]|nr:ThuA domain-containing protein [Oscillospiraceae bacterium]
MIHVHIWNENVQDKEDSVRAVYPDGIHGALAGIFDKGFRVTIGLLDDPDQGLSEEILADTDVILWWGHHAHDAVTDENVQRVISHIHGGMGLVALHSAHHSKVFTRLCGTSANLRWRHDDRERIGRDGGSRRTGKDAIRERESVGRVAAGRQCEGVRRNAAGDCVRQRKALGLANCRGKS